MNLEQDVEDIKIAVLPIGRDSCAEVRAAIERGVRPLSVSLSPFMRLPSNYQLGEWSREKWLGQPSPVKTSALRNLFALMRCYPAVGPNTADDIQARPNT